MDFKYLLSIPRTSLTAKRLWGAEEMGSGTRQCGRPFPHSLPSDLHHQLRTAIWPQADVLWSAPKSRLLKAWLSSGESCADPRPRRQTPFQAGLGLDDLQRGPNPTVDSRCPGLRRSAGEATCRASGLAQKRGRERCHRAGGSGAPPRGRLTGRGPAPQARHSSRP